MFKNTMEKIMVWMVNNVIEFLVIGILATIAIFDIAALTVFYVMFAIVFVASIMYLKKEGYAFGTEDEEV